MGIAKLIYLAFPTIMFVLSNMNKKAIYKVLETLGWRIPKLIKVGAANKATYLLQQRRTVLIHMCGFVIYGHRIPHILLGRTGKAIVLWAEKGNGGEASMIKSQSEELQFFREHEALGKQEQKDTCQKREKSKLKLHKIESWNC